MENWGSGIQRITKSCRESGVPEPEYKDKRGFVTVCFKRPSFINTQTNTQTTVNAILREIQRNPKVSRKQLSELLLKSPETIKKGIAKLKATGKIVREGPQTYGGMWKVIDSDIN